MGIADDIQSGARRAFKPGNMVMVIIVVALFLAYAGSNLPGGPATGRFLGLRG